MNYAFRNCDETGFELTQKMTWTDDDESLDGRAWRLLAVSPHSPLAQGRLVERKFDEVRDRADGWERVAERHPRVATGFAKHYRQADPDRAEKLLRTAAKLSHDPKIYLQLAEIYEQQGKEGRWLATLEEYLKTPSFGLEHVDVEMRIADHYIDQGEWVQAKHYVDSAAQTGSAWGLFKAGNLSEALRDWKAAETNYQAVAQRYRGEACVWYFFCKRTGEGRVKAARQAAADLVATGTLNAPFQATFHLLEKQASKALPAFEKAATEDGNQRYYLMHAAMLADDEKQFDRRDATLRKIAATAKDQPEKMSGATGNELPDLASLFISDLKKDGHAAFDAADVEKQISPSSPADRCNFHYFLGRYLDRCGKADAAIEQWRQCLACRLIALDSRTLAGAALIEHQVRAADYENPLLKAKPAAPQQ